MTKKEKLEMLKAFLSENKIYFSKNFSLKNAQGIVADLYIRRYGRIAVHVSDDKDPEFYNATKRKYLPFFIREEETPEFIIEKMQNTIIRAMKKMQNAYNRQKRKQGSL